MNTLIIESCEKVIQSDAPSSIVHVRNSCILADSLNLDLVSHESQIENALLKKYDVIICAYASPYMRYDKYMSILDNNPDSKLFWLMNDHDVEDNILLRKWVLKNDKTYNMICNNPRSGYRGWILRKKLNGRTLNDYISEWHTINLSALIFDDRAVAKDKSGIVYYGTFRKYRVDDLTKYNDAGYFLSTSQKNHAKFLAAGITAQAIGRLSWVEKESDLFDFNGFHLDEYKYSLYIEDEHTHENYAFMANRFYECLMNDVIMFYDKNCVNTIVKSGFGVLPFQIVEDGSELKRKTDFLNASHDKYIELLEYQSRNKSIAAQQKIDVLGEIRKVLCN